MGNRNTNLELIKNVYAAFGTGDLATIINACSDDIEWSLHGPSSIAWAGTFRGRKGVEQFFTKLMQSLDVQRFEPKHFVADEDAVAVFGFEAGSSRATSKPYGSEWAHHFVIRDGKITSFREFIDTHAIAAAVQGSPSPDGVVH